MSLNSSQDEDAIDYEEHILQPSPSSDNYYELFLACQIPCSVDLERLSEEQIQRLTSVSDRPERTQKQIAKNFLRDIPRVDFSLFAQYKRSRQEFIAKKNARQVSSAEIADYGFSSSEEIPLPPSDDEDYVPEKVTDGSCSTKRKRKAYEEDEDWNPEENYSPRPKKTLRSLRVNTRRKRIESNSSSDGEFATAGSNLSFEEKHDVGDSAFSEPKEEDEPISSSLIDGDLLSNIMREMEDFHASKSLKQSGNNKNNKKSDDDFVDYSRPRQKRRISRVIKITDELTPSVKHVQKVVRNMVNTVCSFERQRVQDLEDSLKRICRWCDSPFVPSNDDVMCMICKDLGVTTTPKTSKTRKTSSKKQKNVKSGAITKIKKRVLNSVPKYDKRRFMYGDKVPKSQQDVPESKVTVVTADIHPEPSDATIPTKRIKLKKSSHSLVSKTPVIKSKQRTVSNSGTNVGDLSLKVNGEKKSRSVDKKDLLRIDFPSSENSQTISTKQPAANNVQYGTYLLPSVPTVVVANYAATDADTGDYYLSSVYYQNEMTQSKNVPSSNIAVAKTNSLPSMPSIDQLTVSLTDHLTPSISFTQSSIPTIKFTQSSNLASVPSVSTGCSIETKIVDSMSFASLLQADNKDEYNPYSLDHDISLLLNNPNLQIQPTNSDVPLNSDIASLFSNSQLQIEPVIPSDDDIPMELDTPLKIVESESEDIPPKELDNSESVDSDPTATVAPKPVNKSKETKESLSTKEPESKPSDETADENASSEALFRKRNRELDAIGILGVVDLDKNPRHSLERIIESNKNNLELIQAMEPKTPEILAKLKQAEDNKSTLQLAKTMLNTFGCFTNLSNSCLRCAKILQIKQEKIEEDEEENRSSCQFAKASQPAQQFVDFSQQLDLSSIEAQISPITPVDPSQYGTTVHHFPIAGSESRETPSRGSGPLTPARPESAMSSTSALAEEPALTPLQIKKERMESEVSPTQSQCSFATPSPARTPIAQPTNPFANPPSQSPHQLNNNLFSTPNNVFPPANPPAYPTSNTSQDTFQILNEMTQRLQSVGQNTQMRNIPPAHNQQTYQLSFASSNNNQQMAGNNHQTLSNTQMQQYQLPGRPPGPPNVTLSNQNLSKVLLNYAVGRQQANNSQANTNYIFKNGGQIMNIQQQQNPQNVMFKNVNVQQQNNVMLKNNQMLNVRGVYIPSSQTSYQAGNQYNLGQQQVQSQMVQQQQQVQSQMVQQQQQVQSQMVQQQQVQNQMVQQQQGQSMLMNNAGQYSFQQGSQQQMQMSRVNMQQNQVVQNIQQNHVVQNIQQNQVVQNIQQNQVVQNIQQNQVVQSQPSQAFMVQNNNRFWNERYGV